MIHRRYDGWDNLIGGYSARIRKLRFRLGEVLEEVTVIFFREFVVTRHQDEEIKRKLSWGQMTF